MFKRVTKGMIMVGIGVLGFAATAFAVGPPPPGAAPEIDAGSAMSALTILTGALTLLGERLRRK